MVSSIAQKAPLVRGGVTAAGAVAGSFVAAGVAVGEGVGLLNVSDAVLKATAGPNPPALDFSILGPLLGAYWTAPVAVIAGSVAGAAIAFEASGSHPQGAASRVRQGFEELQGASSTRAAANAGWKAGKAFGGTVGAVAGGIESFGVTTGLIGTLANSLPLGIAGGLVGAAAGAYACYYLGEAVGGALGAGGFALFHSAR